MPTAGEGKSSQLHFGKRWIKEYFPQQQELQKWSNNFTSGSLSSQTEIIKPVRRGN